ncbi:hypothetical protein [Pseudarthrobacter sp. AB1]|uniref:hypothetical protein n=1 Tax=Pseudarthrobacter sp. AB1 TaxID=2138309 RepID=UPI00186B6F45|nr:hypothetical protein [Pseudarthrobacter sp. AB1]MBE4717798.1 hypothetical protein [Pseudarthrobacter sp. AB1]
MSTSDVTAQIGDLPPIGRPANGALLHAGITSLAEVAMLGRRELLAMHGIGPKSLRILEAAATERGLTFTP